MRAYADYAFYIETFGGEVIDKADYPAVSLYASQYIKSITCGRSELYEGEELKYAMCAVAELYARILQKESGGGLNKKSENIDGYSVTYVTQAQDGELNEALFKKKAYSAAEVWLTGTGLLYRGVKTVL